jgi:hypothetical protein
MATWPQIEAFYETFKGDTTGHNLGTSPSLMAD